MSDQAGHCQELLGAYVLGACSRQESEQIAKHLAECAYCALDARRLSAATGALLADVVPVHAPAQVKDRVMAQVRADASLFDAARARERDASPRGAPAAAWWQRLRGRDSARGRHSPPGRRWLSAPAVAFAAALLIAVVGGGLVLAELRNEPEDIRIRTAQIDHALAPGASARLELQGDQARLRVVGLPAPGRGRVYQVWMRAEREAPRPANATFAVDMRGRGVAELPAAVTDADQLLVTSEPQGGSPLPTRPPVLQVDI